MMAEHSCKTCEYFTLLGNEEPCATCARAYLEGKGKPCYIRRAKNDEDKKL